MTKVQTVSSEEDLRRLEARICTSAAKTIAKLQETLSCGAVLNVLAAMKFAAVGHDPLDSGRSLNLIEQLNQTFTYLASIAGARWLMEHYPECLPLTLNLGTTKGSDIISACGHFAAETFAATHPDSTDKLRKDVEKVRGSGAAQKFVFYLGPKAASLKVQDVTLVRLDHRSLRLEVAPQQ